MTQLELIEHIEKQLRDMLAELGRMKAAMKHSVYVKTAESVTRTSTRTSAQSVLATTTTAEVVK